MKTALIIFTALILFAVMVCVDAHADCKQATKGSESQAACYLGVAEKAYNICQNRCQGDSPCKVDLWIRYHGQVSAVYQEEIVLGLGAWYRIGARSVRSLPADMCKEATRNYWDMHAILRGVKQ